VNAVLSSKWRSAGFKVLDVYKFGRHESKTASPGVPLDVVLTPDGIHYELYIYRAMLGEALGGVAEAAGAAAGGAHATRRTFALSIGALQLLLLWWLGPRL
jgi:hypothetical protein